jgi:hypothetical protein
MGYVNFAKPLDYETKRSDVCRRIKNMEKQVRLWDLLKECLERWDGKKLTKRTETALTKELGTEVRFSFVSGLCYVHIDDERVFIGHSMVLDYNKTIKDQQTVYNNCQDTADRLNKGLDKLEEMVDRYNELLKAQQALVDKSKKYAMQFDFDILCINYR